MCETSRSSWGEWTIRRAPIIGAVIGATLTLAVGLLSMAEIGVPVLVWLLYPAAILTWLFVYGDNGTHLQHSAMTVVIGTVLNAIVGNLLGRLVRVAFRRHFQVSLKAILLSTFWFSIAFAVGAACYRNRHDSWPIMCLISALVGAGVGALGRRSLAGSACGVLLYIAVPYLLFGLMRLADAWWDLRQALGGASQVGAPCPTCYARRFHPAAILLLAVSVVAVAYALPTQAPERSDILNIGGFSDAVFDVIASFLSGDAATFVAEVESIEL